MKRLFHHFAQKAPVRRMPTFRKGKDHKQDQPAPVMQIPEAPTVDHESVRDADPYTFAVAHRRLAWSYRTCVGMLLGSFAINIVLTATIAELVPLKTTEVALVTIDPATSKLKRVNPIEQIRITPITQDIPGYELLGEAFVRRYSLLMLSVDADSQSARMREAARLSDGDFWKDFVKKRKKVIDELISDGLFRSVDIETVELISNRKGIRRYAIEYIKTDEYDGEAPKAKKLRAYISIVAQPQTVHVSEKYTNPTGFRVLSFSARTREIK